MSEHAAEKDARIETLRKAASLMYEAQGPYEERAVWYALGEHLHDIAERHQPDPEPMELVLHLNEDCPTGECVDPGYHDGCIVCRGCYPSYEGMDGHSLYPCVELRSAHSVAVAYLNQPRDIPPEMTAP